MGMTVWKVLQAEIHNNNIPYGSTSLIQVGYQATQVETRTTRRSAVTATEARQQSEAKQRLLQAVGRRSKGAQPKKDSLTDLSL